MSAADDNVLSATEFLYNKTSVQLEYKNHILLWYDEKHEVVQKIMSTRNLFSVQTNEIKPQQMVIHYAEHKGENIWISQSYKFINSNPSIITNWVSVLQAAVKSLTYRPKTLLLFIKKLSSQDKAMRKYEKYVKPILEFANIEVKLIVAQRVLQIHGIVLDFDLDSVDAIACVGTDDTFAEVWRALIARECERLELDPNNISCNLPKISTPIGIIQAGTCKVSSAYSIHGTTDPQSAAIHIALGLTRIVDISTVYQESVAMKSFMQEISYNFVDHTIKPIDAFFSVMGSVWINKGVEGFLTIVCTNDLSHSLTNCYENCPVCSTEMDENSSKQLGWKTITAHFFMITGCNIKRIVREDNSAHTYAHLGDGYIKLVAMYDPTGFTRASDISVRTPNLVKEIYKCKEFSFRVTDGNFTGWKCDEEYFRNPNIVARVHPRVMKVFGRGHKNFEK